MAEELHFGRAAERLHMSQSPLSRAIRDLERDLGVVLFVRTTRRVELTPAGTALLERTRRALAEVDGAIADAQRSGHSDAHVLRVGTGPFSGEVVARLADALRRERPALSMCTEEEVTPESLRRVGTHDLAAAVVMESPRGGPPTRGSGGCAAMDLELSGKVAVVTGASKGIGLAVVRALAAKVALVNVAKALSQELGPKGIRINSVSPGPVATDLWLGDDGVAATLGDASGSGAAAVREQATAGMPTGRFTTPEEVASLVTLLASPKTGNVTGSNYVIDGGLIKTT